MITWQKFNPRAEISAQVAETEHKFQPRDSTQLWTENSSCNRAHYPTGICSKGTYSNPNPNPNPKISARSTGLSSTLGLKCSM